MCSSDLLNHPRNDAPSSSTSTCDHANVIEENARLKTSLAKDISHGKKPISSSKNGKEGLGYVAKAKKNEGFMKDAQTIQAKKNEGFMKDARTFQVKKTYIMGGSAKRGNTTRDDFAGKANPHYILYFDYYGDVYAKYVDPRDGLIACSIWVARTLVTNKRGPITKWVPETKQ